MTTVSNGIDNLQAALAEPLHTFVNYLPWLAAALLLLVAGWLVARVLRAASVRLGTGLNAFLARFNRFTRSGRRLQVTPTVLTLIGNVVFWVVILVSVAMAARIARLDVFTTWLDRVVVYLPTLLAGGLILLAGYLVSTLLRDVVAAAMESAGSDHSELFGLLAQSAIFLAALVIGLDQIGIDVTFLTIVFGIVVGGVLLSIALAFGLGARVFVSNLLGAHQIRQQLETGQLARIDGLEGQVVEITQTGVVLATDQGRLTVPAKLFQEQATLVVTVDDDE